MQFQMQPWSLDILLFSHTVFCLQLDIIGKYAFSVSDLSVPLI